jgi:uncharacterized protein YcbX
MEQIGTIETVRRYPVKSMAGEDVNVAFAGFAGLMGDRTWAFIRSDAPNKGFPWHTAREQENLVLYQAHYRQTAATFHPAEVAGSFALGAGVNPMFPAREAFAVEVVTPEGRMLSVDAVELAAELGDRVGGAVTVRFSERNHFDCRPVSLFGNASVRALGQEIGKPMDRRRFRANFYADWHDDQPFREDTLVGHTLQVGERLRITVLERDQRCKMITIDPDTGEMDASILRHVARVHEGKAGIYAAVLVEGVVRKGDPIMLV